MDEREAYIEEYHGTEVRDSKGFSISFLTTFKAILEGLSMSGIAGDKTIFIDTFKAFLELLESLEDSDESIWESFILDYSRGKKEEKNKKSKK